MRRTLEIADRCNVEIELGRILLPQFPTPEGRDAFDYLVELCEKGLAKRYDKVTPELIERLQFELKTIREMGFADYFLIVADFIGFAKRNGVSVGPGRGCAAGSLAAYCLGITDIDPMRYGLLFERFLNPARKDMPDMDIDFAVEGRERVINYVAEKYGRDRVAQIITFSTMAARAARARRRAACSRSPTAPSTGSRSSIPEGPGQTLEEALKPGARAATGRRGRSGREGDRRPRAPARGADAGRLDPRGRRRDRRAAADRGRAAAAEGRRPEVVTQFSMKNVEALGLLKMDFLGLRNLDVIDKAVRLIGGGLDIGDDPDRRPQDLRDARARRTRRASSSSSRRACATRCGR